MPIYLTEKGALLFAHVPKCGGSSVEDILLQRFGERNSAFLDRRFLGRGQPWTRTSPQHATAKAIHALFPKSFFRITLATVRHPAIRLRSAFLQLRDVHGFIPKGMAFGDWLAELPGLRRYAPDTWDHHVLQMSDFVPEGAVAFPIEHGVEPLIAWLDVQLENVDGPRSAIKAHSMSERLQDAGREPGPPIHLGDAELDTIWAMDRMDYERFGYGRKPSAVPPPPSVTDARL